MKGQGRLYRHSEATMGDPPYTAGWERDKFGMTAISSLGDGENSDDRNQGWELSDAPPVLRWCRQQ